VPPKRILLIDDEDDIREVASMTLETVGGFEVLTAASGQEGIERAIAGQPDAILLDVMMPEMDGPATLLRLQQNPATRDIPVVFLTAKFQAADQRRLAQLGARAIMAKPFDPYRLSDEINEAMGWPVTATEPRN
jgi:CheY-like chemotaxis protein